jgi:hypothetical protein
MDAKTMSDNSRRTICRLAFILLCALPLGLVIYRISHPVTATQWQQAIKADLGVNTQIGSVATPLPFVTQFQDLVLLDDSGLKQLAHIDELKLVTGATNEVSITTPIHLDAASLSKVSQRLRESLRHTNAASNSWKLTINEVTVVREGEGLQDYQVLSPIQVSVFPNPEFTSANIEFFSGKNPQPVSLSVHSYRNESKPHELFKIDTNNAYLPCWLIQESWPEVNSLGPLCEFAGYAEFEQVNGEWAANMRQCELESIELSNLAKPFGQSVRGVGGLAQATIHNCQIFKGKIHSLDLSLGSQTEGSLDSTTADSAKEIFDARWNGETTFDALNVRVSFDQGNFHVRTPRANGALTSYRGFPTLTLPRATIVDAKEMAGFLGFAEDPNVRTVNNATVDFVSRFDIPQQRLADESTANLKVLH